jgi:Protein of unknown function (DUF3224)
VKVAGTYVPTKWDEQPYELIEDRMKATKASVEFALSGDVEGTATVQYLMFYQSFDPKDAHKAVAQYVGLMRMTGKLKGKTGSFVLTDSGNYRSGMATSRLSIVPGSGTGELATISGTGSYEADHAGCNWELEISL